MAVYCQKMKEVWVAPATTPSVAEMRTTTVRPIGDYSSSKTSDV